MTAIETEDRLNQLCVFNLPKELVEVIERLAPPAKLVAVASVLGQRRVKSDSAYAAVVELTAWRNAFAHGHCVDRPIHNTLRHNHLLHPENHPGVPDSLRLMMQLQAGRVRFETYWRKISVNPYMKGTSEESGEIAKYLHAIGRYRFTGTDTAYDVRYV